MALVHVLVETIKFYKFWLKRLLINSGLYYPLNMLRGMTNIIAWLKYACSGAPPYPIKLLVIRAYLQKFKVNTFIETGTYLGDTLEYVARKGVRCVSIEIESKLYEAACKRFSGYRNVKLIQGDSSVIFSQLLKQIESPALFWLDAHYSGKGTGGLLASNPVSAELDAILSHPIKQHVILIDDARLFSGRNGFPHLAELLLRIWCDGNYNVEISADIIRLTPRENL